MPKKQNPIQRRLTRLQLALIRAGLLVGTPLLFLFVLEMVLRISTTHAVYFKEVNPHYYDERRIIRLRPNLKGWWYGCRFEINSHGFRMPHEIGEKKGPRILAIGDSITLGYAVQRGEEVWPMKLEGLLHQGGYATADVINSGIQGWNLLNLEAGTNIVPGEFTAFVQETGCKFSPDIVVYCLCPNDIPSRVHELFAWENERNKARFRVFPEHFREWFKRKATYRLARDRYREARFRQLDFSSVKGSWESPEVWAKVEEEFPRLKRAVAACGARLYCIIVPYSYQVLPANQELMKFNERMHQVLERNGIPWTDITPFLNEGNVLDYFALGDYAHPNAKGQALLAEEVFKLIKKDLNGGGRQPAARGSNIMSRATAP